MSKIPCKKCPNCHILNDFTVEECECGEKLVNISAEPIDVDSLSVEQYGEINTNLKIFVQKCSACGALSYTDDFEHPVTVCYNCNKIRIATIKPIEFVDDSFEEDATSSKADDSLIRQDELIQRNNSLHISASDDEDDDEDDDGNTNPWKNILGSIQKTVGEETKSIQPKDIVEKKSSNYVAANEEESELSLDDDDEDDDADWSNILGTTQKENSIKKKNEITLTAKCYGVLSFTITPSDSNYMLGRSANQSIFLSQDGRVGNEHCVLIFKNDNWYVKDNNSRNGTAVNSKDIGQNGEQILNNGDELKLGHNSDSLAFNISIK